MQFQAIKLRRFTPTNNLSVTQYQWKSQKKHRDIVLQKQAAVQRKFQNSRIAAISDNSAALGGENTARLKTKFEEVTKWENDEIQRRNVTIQQNNEIFSKSMSGVSDELSTIV